MRKTPGSNIRITFFLSEVHHDIPKLLEKEINSLQKHDNTNLLFQEKEDLVLPEVCINGYCVAGLDDIKYQLQSLLS